MSIVVDYLSPSKIHFIKECKLRYVLTLIDGNHKGSKLFNKKLLIVKEKMSYVYILNKP